MLSYRLELEEKAAAGGLLEQNARPVLVLCSNGFDGTRTRVRAPCDERRLTTLSSHHR
jgi:hypothetical protein